MWKATKTSTLVLLAACLYWAPAVHSFYSYDNDFIPPQYFLSKNWSNTTLEAQQTILAWAEETAAKGPWSEYPPAWGWGLGERRRGSTWASRYLLLTD